MRGSIRWRNGAWRLTADAGHDPLGKRRRLNRTIRAPNTRAGRRTAEKHLAELVLEADHQADATSTTTTVAAYLEGWLERRAPDWAPSTRNIEPGVLRRHVTRHIGHLPLVDLRRRHIAELHRKLTTAGVGPPTISHAHRILHRALEEAVTLELLDTNPASKVRPPKVPKSARRAPTDDELDALLAAIDDPQFATILRVDSVLGARRGELAALRWTDLDTEAGILRVTRAFSDGGRGEGLVEQETKTGRKQSKRLDAGTLADLEAHRQRRVEQCTACGVAMDEGGFIFVPDRDPTGATPMRPDRITHQFAAARARAGVSEAVKFHDLRRYVASILLHEGVDVQTVASWLGHSATMTLDTYGEMLPGADDGIADRLAQRRGAR